MMWGTLTRRRLGMAIARLLVRSALALALLVPAPLSRAQDAPAAPAPAPAPATPPGVATTAPSPQPHTVAKGKLSLKIESVGTFLPANPVEIRIRPEAYKGGFTIVSAAAHGAAVKKGDV